MPKNFGEYETTIYLGTPPQAVANVVFDSGSYLPWVKIQNWCGNNGVQSGTCPGIEPSFDTFKSSTFGEYSGSSVGLTYGTGSF